MDFRVSLLGFRSEKEEMIPSLLLMWMPKVVQECLFPLNPNVHYQVTYSTNGAKEPTVLLEVADPLILEQKEIVLVRERIQEQFTMLLKFTPPVEFVILSQDGTTHVPEVKV